MQEHPGKPFALALELAHVSGRYTLTLSAGYALSHDASNIKEAYTHADEALCVVTNAGGAGSRAWEPSLRQDRPRPTCRYARQEH